MDRNGKMICLKCKREIFAFDLIRTAHFRLHERFDNKGDFELMEEEFLDYEDGIIEFKCTECQTILLTSHSFDEATQLLNGDEIHPMCL